MRNAFRFIILQNAETKPFFFSHISHVPEGDLKNHGHIFLKLLYVLSVRQKSSASKTVFWYFRM